MGVADSEALDMVDVVEEEASVDVEVGLVDELFGAEVVAAPPAAVTVVTTGATLLGQFSNVVLLR